MLFVVYLTLYDFITLICLIKKLHLTCVILKNAFIYQFFITKFKYCLFTT